MKESNELELNTVHQGDCLELMKDIPDGSVDMILADLPYGTTRNKWDCIIPVEALWLEYKRIIKTNGAILLTAQLPFDKVLAVSNLSMLRYEWVWVKKQGTGHLNAKKMPLKATENVLVYYKKTPTYNPQMRKGFKAYTQKSGRASSNYGRQVQVVTENNGERYPLNWLEFAADRSKLHPTQKPVALFEYLIKTYTNEGDLVLDNVAGSGTTGVACQNLNRNFILMEQEPEYVEVIKKRLELNEERRNDQSS